jgi:putative transferase (TIGR04331 family)
VLFEKLRDVGIFHEDPKSAAEHVAKIWSDIPGWWQTDSVQGSRSFFCEAVVASRLNIVDTVKDKLLEESSRVAFPVKQ